MPKSKAEVNAVADTLKSAGWTKIKTEEVLLGIIAPHAKRWLGYGLPLVIGEQIDFWDEEIMIPKMRISEQFRAKHPIKKFPFYYFLLPDWLNSRILKRLRVDRLLNLLP